MDNIRQRATAVIIKNKKILLMKRIKPGQEYFTFPGGGVEADESIEDALKREVQEECSLEAKKFRLLFSTGNIKVPKWITIHQNKLMKYYFFLVGEFSGKLEIGGPEKERMSEDNQYHLVWLDFKDLKDKKNIYPVEGVEKLLEFLTL